MARPQKCEIKQCLNTFHGLISWLFALILEKYIQSFPIKQYAVVRYLPNFIQIYDNAFFFYTETSKHQLMRYENRAKKCLATGRGRWAEGDERETLDYLNSLSENTCTWNGHASALPTLLWYDGKPRQENEEKNLSSKARHLRVA